MAYVEIVKQSFVNGDLKKVSTIVDYAGVAGPNMKVSTQAAYLAQPDPRTFFNSGTISN